MIGRVAAVMMAAVAAAAVLSAQPQTARTVWDGVYSPAQARRGEQVFKSECSYCHRDDLSGGFFDGGAVQAPALAGPRAFGSSFAERWKDMSVGEMLAAIAAAMPQQKPSSLTLQQYVDVVSYLFEKNDVPAGSSELTVAVPALGEILITARR